MRFCLGWYAPDNVQVESPYENFITGKRVRFEIVFFKPCLKKLIDFPRRGFQIDLSVTLGNPEAERQECKKDGSLHLHKHA